MAEKKQKFRSPHYPSISLEKAIERAEQLRLVAKDYSVPLLSASKAWGFSEKSSATTTVAAALSQYGLINDEGARQSRRISLSTLAERILLDSRPNSVEKAEAVKEAALSPTIFNEIWEQFGTADVDTHTLVFELTLGRKQAGKAPFSETAAQEVSRLYRETLGFAGLNGGISSVEAGTLGSDLPDSESDSKLKKTDLLANQDDASRARAGSSSANPLIGETDEKSVFEERKALDEGGAILIWPKNLSADSVDDMEYWLNGVLRQIKRRSSRSTD
jgi:hypothetical protein